MWVRRTVVSSVLFTVALLFFAPNFVKEALSTDDPLFQELGVSCLANVLVGLVVTWTAFRREAPWGWFVMFIIVWTWAFPLMILPVLRHHASITFSRWISDAVMESGPHRDWMEAVIVFLLMLIALFVPIRSFFKKAY